MTLIKPSIALPAIILVKLFIHICAHSKNNGGIFCITNICQRKVSCQETSRPHHKRRGCSPTSLCQDPKSSAFSQSQPMHSELMPKEGRSSEERKTFAKHPLPMCIVSLSFHNDYLMYLLLSPFRAEK